MRGSARVALAVCASVAALIALAVAPSAQAAFGPLGSFGSKGLAAGELEEPGGVAVGSNGSVYVADSGNNRISAFSASGQFEFAFGKEVAPGGGDICTVATTCRRGAVGGAAGSLSAPEGIAVDSGGRVYVADASDNRIGVYSGAGEFLYAFGLGVNSTDSSNVCTSASGCKVGLASGAAGGLSGPHGVALAEGHVFVADTVNNRISVFTPEGGFLYAFGSQVTGGGASACTTVSGCQASSGGAGAGSMEVPEDVTPAADGLLAVSDEENGRVDEFTTAGTFVRAFGKKVNPSDSSNVCTTACQAGTADGSAASLGAPTPVGVDATGNIYVGDTVYNRVAEFNSAGTFLRAFGAGVAHNNEAFEVCGVESGCVAGRVSSISGATTHPYGLAVDCRGGIYVSQENTTSPSIARVTRFGEAGTELPPCASGSGGGSGSGSTTPTPPSSAATFTFGKLKLSPKKGTATLAVKVTAAGRLALSGKGLKKATASAAKAGEVKLAVKLVGKAKRTLTATGKAKVKATVTFTPSGGKAVTKTKTLKLKKKRG